MSKRLWPPVTSVSTRRLRCTTPSSSARDVRARRPPCSWRDGGSRCCSSTGRPSRAIPSRRTSSGRTAPRCCRGGVSWHAGGDRRTADLPAHDVRCRTVRASRHHSRRERWQGRVLSAPHGARQPAVERSGRMRGRDREEFHGRRVAGDRRYRGRDSRPRQNWRRRRRAALASSSAPMACNSFVARPVRAPEYDRSPGGGVRLLLILQRRAAGRHRAVRARPLCFRRRTDERRSPPGDGELAHKRVSPPCAPTSRVTCDGRSTLAPEFRGSRARGPSRGEVGTARPACLATSGSRTGRVGRWWATPSYNRDPITAQGISDAFIDAEMLVDGAQRGCRGRRCARRPLWRRTKPRATSEFGRCTSSRISSAALEPRPPEMQALFGALYGNQDATNAFLSAITGAIPLPDFMSTENLGRIMAAAKDVEFHR